MPYDTNELREQYKKAKSEWIAEASHSLGVDLSAVTPSGDEASLKAKIKAAAADPKLAKFLPNTFQKAYLNKISQVVHPVIIPSKPKWKLDAMKPGKIIPFEKRYVKHYVPTPAPEPAVQMVKQVQGRRFREDD